MLMDCPKILVACPISDAKAYCIEEWIEHIQKFKYPNFDIYLVDNSSDPMFHAKLLEKYVVEIDYLKPVGRNVDIICKSRNMIRDKVLIGGYDGLLSIECDEFPPLDTITNFISIKEDVVGAPYFIGSGISSVLCGAVFDKHRRVEGAKLIHKKLEWKQSFRVTNKLVKPFDSFGLGCCYIRRSVLEQVFFRTEPKQNVHDDTFFFLDLHELGIQPVLDTFMRIEHRNSSWQFNSEFNKISK